MGASYLKNFTANGASYATAGSNLYAAGLYSAPTKINFNLMTTDPTVDFYFSGLGTDHYQAYFRVNAAS